MAFTFFFRDWQTLNQVTEHVVPSILGRSRVRMWDAGCAMGPEPYTLAIMLAERMGKWAFKNLLIQATDIDISDQFGDIIREGRYPETELKRIPPELFAKYFSSDGDGYYRIDEQLRSRLEFQKHDLLSLKPVGNGFCLIVCKNVLLHFKQEERIEVFRMFHGALAPEGYLAVEQTQKLPPEMDRYFEKVTGDSQLFKKRDVPA